MSRRRFAWPAPEHKALRVQDPQSVDGMWMTVRKVAGSVVAVESHSSGISSEEPLDLPDISAKATLSPDSSHTVTEHSWAAGASPFLLLG